MLPHSPWLLTANTKKMVQAQEMAQIKSTERLHFLKCLARILMAHSRLPFHQTKKDHHSIRLKKDY